MGSRVFSCVLLIRHPFHGTPISRRFSDGGHTEEEQLPRQDTFVGVHSYQHQPALGAVPIASLPAGTVALRLLPLEFAREDSGHPEVHQLV
eukprot:EC690822.1.p5 GENE.EC690822.1~~EC690822.1.p5  ORF type:complete len:91 (+),score=17.18 EC690822.1:352-624(+)